METVQQNGRFTLFSSKFPSNVYSILYDPRSLYIHISSLQQILTQIKDATPDTLVECTL